MGHSGRAGKKEKGRDNNREREERERAREDGWEGVTRGETIHY